MSSRSPVEWISAYQGLQLFAERFDDPEVARGVLLFCLQEGHVRSRGVLLEIRGTRVKESAPEYGESRPLNADMWDGVVKDAPAKFWEQSHFEFESVWGREADPMGCCEVHNVEIRRADIMKIRTGDRGGRPVNKDQWKQFWMAVIEMAKAGDLEPDRYSNASAFRDAVLERVEEFISESSIRKEAQELYERFIVSD